MEMAVQERIVHRVSAVENAVERKGGLGVAGPSLITGSRTVVGSLGYCGLRTEYVQYTTW